MSTGMFGNGQSNIKNVLRTGLVGIKPADQVMLKGYLRVLLRLESDFEWVSANHPDIDLFLINEEFRHAESIEKLLSAQPDKPYLFVARNRKGQGTGGLVGELLTLPINEMASLNTWLFENVKSLTPKKQMSTKSELQNTPIEKQDKNQAEYSQKIDSINTIIDLPDEESHAGNRAETNNLFELIKTLKLESSGHYQILQNDKVIAEIDFDKFLVCLPTVSNLKYNIQNWRLDIKTSDNQDNFPISDLKQWLWHVSANFKDELSLFIDDSQNFRLDYWVKPKKDERSTVLPILTVIEKKASNINDIAKITGIDQQAIRHILARLLFSGYLNQKNYVKLEPKTNLSDNQASEKSMLTKKDNISSPLDKILLRRAAGEPKNVVGSSEIPDLLTSIRKDVGIDVVPAVVQEKKGFLSRLRKKLGL